MWNKVYIKYMGLKMKVIYLLKNKKINFLEKRMLFKMKIIILKCNFKKNLIIEILINNLIFIRKIIIILI